MDDLKIDRSYRRGNRGAKVNLIQEWLTLQGFAVVVDGIFGPATEAAVQRFQSRKRIARTGVVNRSTFAALTAPMRFVREPITARSSLGATVVAYAKRHLRQHPVEVGGQNKGPWVRLYMNGREGVNFPWCAGFACFVLKQAADAFGVPLPIKASVSCDALATSAKSNDLFLAEKDADGLKPSRGSFFLSRRTPTDWTHVGIVTSAGDESFATIEGNTNDDGSREGFEVCARFRGYGKKDFILI